MRWLWLGVSGMTFGLGLLTKLSAIYMAPAVVAIVVAGGIWSRRVVDHDAGCVRQLRWLAIDGLVWITSAGLLTYCLWPALWGQPFAVLLRAIEFSARLGGTPHGPGNFLLGQVMDDPGPLFYPIALGLRLGPGTTLGLLLLLALGLPAGARRIPIALLLTAGLYVLLLTASPKKVDRYLLPIIPLLTMVAALGWWRAIEWLRGTPLGKRAHSSALLAALCAVTLVQAWPLLASGRYPLAAYNPLFGGARTAERAIPVGWGEGLDDAATIIRTLSPDGPVTTATWFPLRVNLQAHVPGPVVNERQLASARYFVDYIHARQRQHTPAQLRSRLPDGVVTINGVEYVRVYRLP